MKMFAPTIILIGVIAIILLSIFATQFSKNFLMEGFQETTPASQSVTADALKAILKKSKPSGEDITAIQGAYEQFLNLQADFCKLWVPFLETGRQYEQKSSNETGNGGSAVGMGTLKEYTRLIGLREGKIFVDCSVRFPERIDIGITAQQMPYESQAYIDSLDYGIAQLKKIQDDTKKALTSLPIGSSAPSASEPAPAQTKAVESFLDLMSENCEEKDGTIRCVISIDTTNRNLIGRATSRLVEILEAEQKIREKMLVFQREMRAVDELKARAESGEIAKDIKIQI